MSITRSFADTAFSSLIALLTVTFLSWDCALHAQVTTGDLRFRTVDSLARPVSGVNISLTGANVQGTRGGTSDSTGLCVLMNLPPGVTAIRLGHASYQPVLIENVLVQLGKTRDLGEVFLKGRTHNLPEVVISGRRGLIDPLSASSSVNLRSMDLENLPLERNYKNIVSIVPQANASYFGDDVNIGGATGWENKYFVDGADVTDPHFQSTGTTLPFCLVKEIQVITGGYEAEYRSSLGGIINVVTPSGGNEFHGSAFGFLENNRLAAARSVGPLDLTQGPYSNYDVGFGMGGPILRNQLWFYAVYNPISKSRDVLIPGIGVYVDQTTIHAFGAKLSWRASEQLNVTLTSTGDPSKRQAIGEVDFPALTLLNPDPYLSNIKGGGVNVSLKGTYTVGDNLLIDGSLARVTRDELTEPSTERGKNEILFWDGPTSTYSGGSFLTWSSFRTSTSAKVSATLLTANHTLKAGAEFRDNGVEVNLRYSYLLRISDVEYFIHENGDQSFVHNRLPSLFLQDCWRISRGLSLNFGLRWDGQYLIGNDGRVHQRFNDQFQPRVGFLILPGGKASQKIYGSFGRYFEELGTCLTQSSYSDKFYFYQAKYAQNPRGGGAIGDTTWLIPLGTVMPEVNGLKGQYYDEFSLGYERRIVTNLKVTVQALYRTLREAIAGVSWNGKVQIGNPGRGNLTGFPRAQRDYTALALTLEKREAEHFNFVASYVLSRNYGNYPGLFNVYFPSNGPNTSLSFFHAEGLKLGTGLLPNDRTHVFKFSGFYRFDLGLSVGTSFIWQSGTPWSDLAGFDWYFEQRGTAGRTPATWDLSARLSYELPVSGLMQTRLILDVNHIASQRRPVDIIQQRSSEDPNGYPIGVNPNFGVPSRYQPPMSVRLGMEVSF